MESRPPSSEEERVGSIICKGIKLATDAIDKTEHLVEPIKGVVGALQTAKDLAGSVFLLMLAGAGVVISKVNKEKEMKNDQRRT